MESTIVIPPEQDRRFSKMQLWRTLRRVAVVASHKVALTALTLFYCLQDRDTPGWAKGVIVGALGYLVLPVDLIPDLVPGAGYSDDWGAIVAALATVSAYVKEDHKTKASAQVRRLFGEPKPTPPAEFFE